MDGEPVTLVCGLGRCGTSLVMQMLWAAELPVTGKWPGFERYTPLNYNPGKTVLYSFRPGAVYKVLDVHDPDVHFAMGRHYRSIWMDRNPREQAKSMRKIVAEGQRNGWPLRLPGSFRRELKHKRARSLRRLQDLGPVMVLDFEQLIQQPMVAAGRLAGFLEVPDKRDAMANMVLNRDAFAAPDLGLEKSLGDTPKTW